MSFTHHRPLISLGLVLGSAGALALVSACQDTGAGGSGGGTTGVVTADAFKPQGCGFQVAPRAEYKDYSSGKTDVGATPNIRRVRLGLGGNVTPGAAGHADPTTTMGFAWETDDGTLVSQVQWGSTPDPTSWPKTNVTSGVTWLTPHGLTGNDERMHEAYVCGLTPATTYYYRVGGGPAGKEVWGADVYSFTTAPSDPNATITIAVTGDSRGEQQDAWRILQKRVLALAPTLQLFSGDMINLATDQGEWEEWLDNAWKGADGKPSTLGQVLTLAAHGNHDNHTALFFGNLVLPQDVAKYPKYTEQFFSVDVGPAHLVVLDDAWLVFPNGDQAYGGVIGDWLEADLAAADANRAKVPWVIAVHHHPEYSSSTHGKDADVIRGRNFLEPIWEKHHADLVLAGHDHDYERSKPLTGPIDNPTSHPSSKDGTVYLVCAGSGADAYSSNTSTFTAKSHDFSNGGAIGLYGILKVTKSSLQIDAHELHVDGSDPIFDTVTMTK